MTMCVNGPNSFLHFMVTNADATRKNLLLHHSCDCLFQKIEVLHGGNVLGVFDNYNQLSHMLLDAQVHPSVHNTSLNMSKGCKQMYGSIKGATLAKAATGYYFTTTLISGIVGSLV